MTVVLLGFAACDIPVADDNPDAAPPPPTIQIAYAGTYTTSQVLDLSHPFGGDGVGGAVADLMIDQIITLAGVPGALEGEARDLLADAIRQPIVDQVNGVIPAELVTSSPEMTALAAIFGNVEAGGTLTLTAGSDPDLASGTETISSLHLEHETDALDVSMSELLDGAVSVAAALTGTATGATSMSIAQHEFELRFGVLVQIAARELLGLDANALGQQAIEAVDCAEIVDRITGGETSYAITVGGQGFSVTAEQLTTGCGDLRTELVDEALGMIRPDAGLRLGGPITFAGSGTATGATSSAGYGGAITALSFGPVEPQVTSTLTATR